MLVPGSQIVAGVLLLNLALAQGADNHTRAWQEGEIVAIRQDVFADGNTTAYVYSLRAKEITYRIAFASPLKASIHSKVKFAIEKKSLCVQDLDGKPHSAEIIEQAGNGPPR